MTESIRSASGEPHKDQRLLNEFDPDTVCREPLHQQQQVIQVPCKPVRPVHHQGVPVPAKAQQLLELRASGVHTRGLVREDSVQLDALELQLGVLVQTVDP